jgi:hypothetical protein
LPETNTPAYFAAALMTMKSYKHRHLFLHDLILDEGNTEILKTLQSQAPSTGQVARQILNEEGLLGGKSPHGGGGLLAKAITATMARNGVFNMVSILSHLYSFVADENKLECLPLASHNSLVYCLQVRPWACTIKHYRFVMYRFGSRLV